MEYGQLVRDRRSIRGYKTDPVPKEVILEIVELASGAPSSMNTQPWNFYIVTGEPLARIREERVGIERTEADHPIELRDGLFRLFQRFHHR